MDASYNKAALNEAFFFALYKFIAAYVFLFIFRSDKIIVLTKEEL